MDPSKDSLVGANSRCMDAKGVSDFNDASTVGTMTNNELHAEHFHFRIKPDSTGDRTKL